MSTYGFNTAMYNNEKIDRMAGVANAQRAQRRSHETCGTENDDVVHGVNVRPIPGSGFASARGVGAARLPAPRLPRARKCKSAYACNIQRDGNVL